MSLRAGGGLARHAHHAQRRRDAQHVPLDQVLPCLAVEERGPRHFRQLLVRHNQHLRGALETLEVRGDWRKQVLVERREPSLLALDDCI